MHPVTTLTFSVVILTALGNGAPQLYFKTGRLTSVVKRKKTQAATR